MTNDYSDAQAMLAAVICLSVFINNAVFACRKGFGQFHGFSVFLPSVALGFISLSFIVGLLWP